MHIMYVDESGDPGLPSGGEFGAPTDPSRFYVRAGIIVHGWRWMHVDRRIASLKAAFQMKWDDEIKATWIRRGKKHFEAWSAAQRQTFIDELLNSISRELDISIIVVAIDKSLVNRTARPRMVNPAVRSLELLLERYNQFLRDQRDKSGILILDECESKSDQNLRYFQSYLLNFSENLDPRRIVEGTMFMPSHTSNLLQVADVCANVAYRRFARDDENTAEYGRIKARIYAEKVWPKK